MSTGTGPDDKEHTAQPAESEDDSVVSPPAYPAYSTPPPEGLATPEDG
ncbi:hypothetical protein [Mycobacterium szulgai]|nr:hypothetical protein [Mycobacterium szulgai]MCV7076311.1 hypothetical protein [Mycobacterium szulgai]